MDHLLRDWLVGANHNDHYLQSFRQTSQPGVSQRDSLSSYAFPEVHLAGHAKICRRMGSSMSTVSTPPGATTTPSDPPSDNRFNHIRNGVADIKNAMLPNRHRYSFQVVACRPSSKPTKWICVFDSPLTFPLDQDVQFELVSA